MEGKIDYTEGLEAMFDKLKMSPEQKITCLMQMYGQAMETIQVLLADSIKLKGENKN